MDTYFYYNLIRKTTIQLLNVFNGVKIAKFDKDHNILEYINVPIKLSSKQKFYLWLNDQKENKIFPIMAMNLVGMNPAINSRGVNSNHLNILNEKGSTYRNPIPWDFDFDLYIASNYVLEAEQILEQILPWFSPFVMVNMNIPEINNNLDLKIICNSAMLDKNIEMGEGDQRYMTWTLNLLVKGYMMKPVKSSDIINTIDLNYIPFKERNEIPFSPLSGYFYDEWNITDAEL